MRRRSGPFLLLALHTAACSAPGDTANAPAATPAADSTPAVVNRPEPVPDDTLQVVFTRGEAPVHVIRVVPARSLTAALEALLQGPEDAERGEGMDSWFSASTARALRSVTVSEDGLAIVDFNDLHTLIPNASSAAGSATLLHELNGTVFQFANVTSVEYRINGSCARFWEWLQRSCEVVRRP